MVCQMAMNKLGNCLMTTYSMAIIATDTEFDWLGLRIFNQRLTAIKILIKMQPYQQPITKHSYADQHASKQNLSINVNKQAEISPKQTSISSNKLTTLLP